MATVLSAPASLGLAPQMVFIGGTRCSVGFYNDVWVSDPTGFVWTLAAAAPFPRVMGAGITTVQKGSQIILAGGTLGGGIGYNTVWMGAYNSTKQLSWTLVCSAAVWSPRSAEIVATSNDYLYLIDGELSVNRNEVYVSADAGYSWLLITASDSFSARIGASLVSVGRQLILIGGMDAVVQNDIWQVWAN